MSFLALAVSVALTPPVYVRGALARLVESWRDGAKAGEVWRQRLLGGGS